MVVIYLLGIQWGTVTIYIIQNIVGYVSAKEGRKKLNKPDLLTVWPKDTDYPLFRYSLAKYRDYFDQVYIAISDNGTLENYTNFFTTAIPDAHFKFIPRADGSQDWRNVAVNTLLEKSQADRVLFIEQDFLIKDERFFEVLLNVNEYDALYYDEQGRMHPALALVPRHIIEKTSKDFSARPPAYDHFGLFFKELMGLCNATDLETVGLHQGEDFYHLAGLTQNYHAQPFFKPNEFLTYNRYALKLPIPFNEFRLIMEKIDREHPFLLSDTVMNVLPKEAKQ